MPKHPRTLIRQRRAAHRAATAPIRVSQFLTAQGYDEEFVDRYGPTFAKHAARHYRAAHHGHDPRTGRKLITIKSGRRAGQQKHIPVFVYAPNDPALRRALDSYPRTAAGR